MATGPSEAEARPPGERRGAAIAVGVLAVVAVVSVPLIFGLGYVPSPSQPNPASILQFASHIQHVIFVVLENHAYDNYFGTYCTVVGPYCPTVADGIPPGSCVPMIVTNPSAGCVRPYAYTKQDWSLSAPLPHDFNSSTASYDHGRMDGFYAAENSGTIPFGYYNGTTAPIVWDIAEEYALDDQFFSSLLSYSLPNHWHIVAGSAPNASIYWYIGQRFGSPVTPISVDHQYLNESNETASVQDLLLHTTVSWKYYDAPLTTYQAAIQDTVSDTGMAYSYWNPLAAKAESYTSPFSPHFVRNSDYFGDAANGTLPSLSWLIPPATMSDHPAYWSSAAQGWLGSVVDALESSPNWNTSAMFITWDDYGGFYDHVSPPIFGGQPVGFRVPLLVVSPYARENYVSSQFQVFESILHLMELRYGLGCLTALDCNAPVPLDTFDFTQSPRAPMLFATDVNQTSYPIGLERPGPAGAPLTFVAPEVYSAYESAPGID